MLFHDGAYEADDISEASGVGTLKDLVLSPLVARKLEEARIRGWGARSLDFGNIPTIHGPTLYQLRALLFARSQITSLCLPALPDAEQVYNGVNMPALDRLVIRCRFAEHPDVIGTLQAFASNPAHSNVRTLALTDAYVLPRALGRLKRNTALRLFLRHITHFEISGRSVFRPGEGGASRHLLRFIAAMPALASLSYDGYVPGMPAFQVIRISLATRAIDAPPMQHLSISQLSHDGGPPSEDAHLLSKLSKLSRNSGPALRLALGVGLDAPELSRFGSGPRLAALELTLTPDATHALQSVVIQNRDTLRELRITTLPAARGKETANMWRAMSEAASRATSLDVLHFSPMLPLRAPPDAPARIIAAARDAVEILIHAPGCAEEEVVRKVYLAALNEAEGCTQLQRLVICVSTEGIDEQVEALRTKLQGKIGSIELGKSRAGDGDYSPVPLVNPKKAGRLWPVLFLLNPWATNTIIVITVLLILITLALAAFGIAITVVKKLDKNKPKEPIAP